jgi:hypothetical protein
VAETAGSVGSGGRLAGEWRECDGSVTEEGPRHGERGKSTLPCVLSNSHGRDAWIEAPIGARYTHRDFGPCFQARKGTQDARKRDVPGIFVTVSARCGFSRTSASRKSDLVPAFLHTCGTSPSRASRWRPQPARAAIETPGTHLGRPPRPRTPVRTAAPPSNPASDGRTVPEPRLGRPAPPRTLCPARPSHPPSPVPPPATAPPTATKPPHPHGHVRCPHGGRNGQSRRHPA